MLCGRWCGLQDVAPAARVHGACPIRNHTVDSVGNRRSAWWVLAELGQRLGHQLADTTGAQVTDDAMLAGVAAAARVPLQQLIGERCTEVSHHVPAPWVDRHVERLGGWRLAPRLLVDQLATLRQPAPLVLVPRRQRSQLNSQLELPGRALRSPDSPS